MRGVRQLRVARTVVDGRDAERVEPGHVGPAQLGPRGAAHGRGERRRGRALQARPGAAGHVGHGHRPAREDLLDVGPGLLRRPVGGKPVVHGDHALVRDHVAGHAAAHADRVQPLVVGQPVDVGLAGLVVAQDVEDRAGVVDGVAAHPGPGAVRALPGDRDLRPQRALAAALDHPAGRLHQHREVAGQLVRHHPAQPQQPVAGRFDFLAVVEHVGHVTGWSGDSGGQPELDGYP